uniref:Uncharacterized protein n=1 Tax=viral metagenome TaxID=1070528 RepID=A0A6C0BP80_9ZZZZ
MDITNGSLRYHLTEEEYTKSPYLTGVKGFTQSINCNSEDPTTNTPHVLQCSNNALQSIVNFLKTGHADVAEDNYEVYELLGFINRYDYPLDYSSAELTDTYTNPSQQHDRINSDSESVSKVNKVLSFIRSKIRAQAVVEGRTTLRLIRGLPVDIVYISFINPPDREVFQCTIRSTLNGMPGRIYDREIVVTIQNATCVLNLTPHSSIDTMLNQERIDCLRCAYSYNCEANRGSVIMTKRCEYSLQNECNWYHPELHCSDYIDQLLIYSQMGFKATLPSFNISEGLHIDLKALGRRLLIDYLIIYDCEHSRTTAHRWRQKKVKLLALRLIDLFKLGDIITMRDHDPCYYKIEELSDNLTVTDILTMRDDLLISKVLNSCLNHVNFHPQLSDVDRLILCSQSNVVDIRDASVLSHPQGGMIIDKNKITFPGIIEYDGGEMKDVSICDLLELYGSCNLPSIALIDSGLSSQRYHIFNQYKMLSIPCNPWLGCDLRDVQIAQCLVNHLLDLTLNEYYDLFNNGTISKTQEIKGVSDEVVSNSPINDEDMCDIGEVLIDPHWSVNPLILQHMRE